MCADSRPVACSQWNKRCATGQQIVRGYCQVSGLTPSTLSTTEGVMDVCVLQRQREVSENDGCVMVGSCSTAVALVRS